MTDYTIGNYKITSLQAYETLQAKGVTSDAALASLDKDENYTISEDDLVELDTTDTSSTAQTEEEDALEQLEEDFQYQMQEYNETARELEMELIEALGEFGEAEDLNDTTSSTQEVENIKSQIDENSKAIRNLIKNYDRNVERIKTQYANTTSSAASNSIYRASNATFSSTGFTNLNGDFGSNIASVAASYVGKLKESDGSYLEVTNGRAEAWCADFVTYVVNQAAEASGVSMSGFGSASVSGLMAWGQGTNRYSDVSSLSASERTKYVTNNVSSGDIVILKNNGVSHTAIVESVNSDGSFVVISGNTSDEVKRCTYNANMASLSGFISMA